MTAQGSAERTPSVGRPLSSEVEVDPRLKKPAGWRRSTRCLGFTQSNGKKMEVLQDPQAPTGKRLVPTLESTDRSDLYVRRKTSKDGATGPRRRASIASAEPAREFCFSAEVLTTEGEASAPEKKTSPLTRRGSAPTIRIDLSQILAQRTPPKAGRPASRTSSAAKLTAPLAADAH